MPDYERPYDVARFALLEQVIPRGSGAALDIGCYDGTTTELLSQLGYEPTGVDLDREVIDRGRRQRPSLDLRVGTVSDARDRAPYALISCLEVIEHVDAPRQLEMMREIRELLATDGVLVLSTPGRRSLVALLERLRHRIRRQPGEYKWWDPTHVEILSWPRLRRLLGQHGFKVELLVGYHYLPKLHRPPRAIRRWPLNRAGFDLVVVARPQI